MELVHLHCYVVTVQNLPRIDNLTGMSSTFAGQRLSKAEAIFEALGTTDELSSMIG